MNHAKNFKKFYEMGLPPDENFEDFLQEFIKYSHIVNYAKNSTDLICTIQLYVRIDHLVKCTEKTLES